MSEDKQNQSRDEWRSPRLSQRRACCFEKVPVRHAGWTGRLAGPASETTIDVRVHRRVIRRDRSFEQRPHQENSSARTLVFILESQICRTRLEAEATMNTRVDSRKRCLERRSGQRARWDRVRWCRRVVHDRERSAHARGPRIPGFRMLFGSNARFTR